MTRAWPRSPGTSAARGWPTRSSTIAVSRWGKADILVNDAASYPDGTLLEMPADAWERVFSVNVTGTFMMTQAFARHCVGRGARDAAVVSISTGSARSPRPAGAAYSASKAAVETMSKVFAMELGPHGIRVNVVSPGYIDVRGWSDAYPDRAPEETARGAGPLDPARPGRPPAGHRQRGALPGVPRRGPHHRHGAGGGRRLQRGPVLPARPRREGAAAVTAGSEVPAAEAAAGADVPIIETVQVAKHFSAGRDALGRTRPSLKAVDGVSLTIRRGETLALVGETGSGKTTFGRLLLGLYRPTSGDIRYRGVSILDRKSETARAVRRQVQGVFQDPYSSLNPTMTIGQSLTEVLKVHHVVGRKERADRVAELLRTVGLSTAQAARRPHAFSGGERQRVGIARALAVEPEVVIADEPLSALDVSIQAQVLNLMIRLQEERGLTYLFVTHDLDVARHISQRTAVLYLGRVVEQAPTEAIFAEPLHPYTQALVRAAPRLTTHRKAIKPALTGDIPNAIERPSGCHFHPRCPMAMPVCREREPALIQLPGGRSVTCHLHDPEVMAQDRARSGNPVR